MPAARRASPIEPLLLAYKQAGEMLGGISDQMVMRLVAHGMLEGRRLGRRRYVTTLSVKRLAATGTPDLVSMRPEKYRTVRPEGYTSPGTAAAIAARRRGRP